MSGRISEKSRLLLTTILWGMTFSEKAIRAIHGWHFLWLRFPASDKFPNQPTAPGEWKEEVSPTCSWKNHFHPVSLGLLKLRKQTIWDLRLQLASFVGGVHFGNNLVEKVIHKLNFSGTQMLSKVLHHCHCLSWLVHYLQPVLSRVMKQIFVGNHWQSLEMCFCKRSWVIDFHRYDSAANPVQPPWHCRKLSLSICANFFASDGICFAISPPGVSETSENEPPNHPKSFHKFLVHDCLRLLNLWESLVTPSL